jgi:sporulation integral membrane protein YlbJ
MTSKKTCATPLRFFVTVFSILAFVLIIKYSNAAINSVKSALDICASTVIPSLFPFMVISELAISLGAAKYIGKVLSPLFRPLFNINEHGASAFLLGALCGFPVGARTAAALYDQGKLDDKQLTHVLCFCNNPSSAFVISAVGISLFGSHSFGIALYIITLMSSLIVGFALRFVYGGRHIETRRDDISDRSEEKKIGVHIFTKAVSDSAYAMLIVCAFIVFFSALLGTLNAAFEPLSAPDFIIAAVKGFFELTAGVSHVSSNLNGESALLLCAFIVGWSGLSVHFQIMAICKDHKISFRPYFVAKAAQGALSALIMCAYLRIFKPKLSISVGADAPAFLSIPKPLAIICLVFFVASIIVLCFKKATKIYKKRRYFSKSNQ